MVSAVGSQSKTWGQSVRLKPNKAISERKKITYRKMQHDIRLKTSTDSIKWMMYLCIHIHLTLLSRTRFINSLCPFLECPRTEIYFIALIDILTHYGVKKRTAQAAKTVKHGAGAEISTVKPDQYARRLLEFIEKIIE